MKNSLKILVGVFAVVALSAQVLAIDPAGAVVSGATDYGEYDQGGAGTAWC